MYTVNVVPNYLEVDDGLIEFIRVPGHEEDPFSVLRLEGLALGNLLTTEEGAAGEKLTNTLNKTDINGKTIWKGEREGREREREFGEYVLGQWLQKAYYM